MALEPRLPQPEAPEDDLPTAHNTNARNVAIGVVAVIAVAAWLLLRNPDEGPPPAQSTAEEIVELGEGDSPAAVIPAAATGTKADASAVTPGFVRIEPGRFTMGFKVPIGNNADAPHHVVKITRPFEIQKTEVTQRQYKAVTANNPAWAKHCGEDCPVEMVSWVDAAAFCNRLSKRRGLPQCYTILPEEVQWRVGVAKLLCGGYRLPTEAEWEYAARAGHRRDFPDKPSDVSWYDNNSGVRAHKVGTKKANAWGLYDMLGNVAEWVWDWQGDYKPGPLADPTGPATGKNKVFRGGSHKYGSNEAVYAARNGYGPLNKVRFIGFRCARTLK